MSFNGIWYNIDAGTITQLEVDVFNQTRSDNEKKTAPEYHAEGTCTVTLSFKIDLEDELAEFKDRSASTLVLSRAGYKSMCDKVWTIERTLPTGQVEQYAISQQDLCSIQIATGLAIKTKSEVQPGDMHVDLRVSQGGQGAVPWQYLVPPIAEMYITSVRNGTLEVGTDGRVTLKAEADLWRTGPYPDTSMPFFSPSYASGRPSYWGGPLITQEVDYSTVQSADTV